MKMNFNRTKLGGVILVFLFFTSTINVCIGQSPVLTDITSRVYYRENVDLGATAGYVQFENTIASILYDPVMPNVACGKHREDIELAPTGYTNNMTITPILSGDADDGASGLDLAIISQHIDGINDLPSPWDHISADADNDEDVDEDDIDLIRDVIFGYEDEFVRPVWEWLPGWVTEDYDFIFESDPYALFGYSFNYPPLNTSTVTGNIPRYFNFKATKVGDIYADNSYLCTGVNNLGSDILTSRSLSKWSGVAMERDERIILDVTLIPESDLVSIQLPIAYNQEDFEVISVKFADGNALNGYGYNQKRGHLILLHYLRPAIPFSEAYEKLNITVELKAKRKIYDVHSSVSWSSNGILEFGGADFTPTGGDADLEIRTIIPNDVSGRILGMENPHLELKLPIDDQVLVEVYNVSGQLLTSNRHQMQAGYNLHEIPNIDQSGIFFASAIVAGKRYTYKFVK